MATSNAMHNGFTNRDFNDRILVEKWAISENECFASAWNSTTSLLQEKVSLSTNPKKIDKGFTDTLPHARTVTKRLGGGFGQILAMFQPFIPLVMTNITSHGKIHHAFNR